MSVCFWAYYKTVKLFMYRCYFYFLFWFLFNFQIRGDIMVFRCWRKRSSEGEVFLQLYVILFIWITLDLWRFVFCCLCFLRYFLLYFPATYHVSAKYLYVLTERRTLEGKKLYVELKFYDILFLFQWKMLSQVMFK